MTDCSCNSFPASLGPVYIEAGLGVGIATPQALAQLHGTAGLLILDDANQSGAAGYWRLAVNNGSLELDQNTSANRDFSTFRGVLRTDGSGNLQLGGSSGYGSAAPTMVVGSNAGNVGVGTLTPQARLDVVGLLRVAGGVVVLPLGTPAAPTVTPTPSGGSTTWGYVVTAVSEDGTETVGSPEGQTASGPATLSATSYNTVSTTAVPGAVAYNVYRTTASGSPSSTGFLAQVTGPYEDTGAAAQSGRLPPSSDQSSWVGVGTSTPAGRLDLVGGGFLAIDNGDFSTLRGLRFRNTTDSTTPTGGGLYQGSDNTVSLQAGQASAIALRDSAGNLLGQFTNASGGTLGLPTGARIQPLGLDSTDALSFVTAGGMAIVALDSLNQRVGIGTTSPQEALHLEGTNVGIRIGSTAQGGLDYNSGSGDLYLGGDNGQAGDFYVRDSSGAIQVAVRSDGDSYLAAGRLGVGTGSPLATLDVNGYLHTAGSTNPSVGVQGAFLNWNALNGGGTGETDFINNQGGGPGGFAFFQSSGGTLPAPLLFITGGGNVGIGTSGPQKPLDVAVAGGIRISQTDDMSDNNELYFADNGQIRSSDDNHRIIFDRTNDILELREFGDIVFSPGASAGQRTQVMTIFSNGNVGIGTTNPTQQLDITGNLQCNGILVSSNILMYGALQNSLAQTLVDSGGCYYSN